MNKLNIKLFADGADLQSIIKLSQNDDIKGFTTNPTLMRKAGVQDYKFFAKDVLKHITPITRRYR
jgi:transaldolase